jgi:serine/threonine-protein kinase
MPSKRDISCGKLAVQNGFMTEQQVHDCMKFVEEARKRGQGSTFEEIAEARGFLGDKEALALTTAVRRIERDSEKKSMSIEGYEMLSKIGEGGLATVFKARQVSMNRIVALKILHKKWLADEEFRKRFLLEARLVGKLSHENLIKVFDVGRDDWKYYYSMEFVEGETCEDIIEKHGPLEPVRALEITSQIAKAIDYLKGFNIVHCDIKPGNIMFTKNGTAKLGDFGFVRANIEIEGEEGFVLGTPDYISPEQAIGSDDIDFRSDIYSLGASLYHMLTGRTPFDGTGSEVMRAHIRKSPMPINTLKPALSRETITIVDRLLEKDPGDRYQSMVELLDDLSNAMIAEDPDAQEIRSGESTLFDAFKREKFRAKRMEEEKDFIIRRVHDYRIFFVIVLVLLILSFVVNVALFLRIIS